MGKVGDISASYGESDAFGGNRTVHPILAPGIGRRIALIADRIGTRKNAYMVAGVSSATIQRYISGETAPTFEAVAKMCLAAGVRLEWLATGDGPMLVADAEKPAPASHSQPARTPDAQLELGVLSKALAITEGVLRRYGLRDTVDSDALVRLVKIVFDDLAQGMAEDAASADLDRILSIAGKPRQP